MLDGEGRIRRVYLHRPSRLDRAQVEGSVTRGHLELEKIRLMVLQAELCVCPSAHEGPGADLDLQSPLRPSVEQVTRGKRGIDLRLRPVLGPRAPE